MTYVTLCGILIIIIYFGPLLPELLSTHPAGPKRLERKEEECRAIKSGGEPKKGFFRRLMKKKDPAAKE